MHLYREAEASLNKTLRKLVDTIETNRHDSLYTDDIYVGHPPQKMRALFDTGSQHIFLLSSQTKVENSKFFHYYYDQGQSLTAQALANATIPDIQFGTGTMGGHFIKEQIRVGTAPQHFQTHAGAPRKALF